MKKVITYGSFDLFHEGHYNLLKNAKALGDTLIVGVTTEHYDAYRGKLNIVDPLITRMDNVRGSGFADEIIVEDHEGQKLSDIQKYGIDIFTVGADWRGEFDYLKDYCEVTYLERTHGISSTLLRNERKGIVRMGIAGSGRIADRFASETKYVSGLSVPAVYNPHIDSARSFAGRRGVALFMDDYDKFLGEADAVYVATPHETHYGYAKRAILAGKHVLCEKPMVLCEAQARELFDLAQARGVILMEAVKTAFLPAFLNLLAIAKSGRIGHVRDVESAFTRLMPDENRGREFTPGTGGSFTELGSYPLLPVIKILGLNYTDVRFESFTDENGLDIYTKAHFKYDGAIATSKTGLGVKSEGQLLISGTRGYILVQSPWWLTQSFEVCYEDVQQNERFFAKYEGFGLRYELADFVRAVGDAKERNFKMSAADSVAMAGIMEKFLAQRPVQ